MTKAGGRDEEAREHFRQARYAKYCISKECDPVVPFVRRDGDKFSTPGRMIC